MRIGFDASVIFSSVGGTRTYAIQLLTAMLRARPDWTYFMYSRSHEEAAELGRRWSDPNVHLPVVTGAPNAWRLQARLPARLRHDAVDLYHSLGYFLPLRWSGPKVVTVHDLNVYLNWRSWARPNKFLNWADLVVQTPLAARTADRIITDSRFSKASICRILRVAPDKVAVVPLAPDEFFDEPSPPEEVEEARVLTAGGPFVLHVGVLAPQKNLGTLIRAFARSALPNGGVRLVLAGSDQAGHGAALREIAAFSGVSAQLVIPGRVGKGVLRALYHQALAVVLPSHGEGFGLPLVEAMAAGAPVLAANRQSLPEVVGDAGSLFAPDDVGELAALLDRLIADPAFRSSLVSRGYERRREFSWSSAAEQTAEIYEELLSSRR